MNPRQQEELAKIYLKKSYPGSILQYMFVLPESFKFSWKAACFNHLSLGCLLWDHTTVNWAFHDDEGKEHYQ